MAWNGVHQEPRPVVGGEVARGFLLAVLVDPAVAPLLSGEHFSVDGTLIEAWAAMKSFQPQDPAPSETSGRAVARRPLPGAPRARFPRREALERDPPVAHRSRGAALPQGGRPAGEIVLSRPSADGEPQRADRRCRADAGYGLGRAGGGESNDQGGGAGRPGHPRADKAYDAAGHVANLRRLGVTPHVAQNTSGRRSAIDGRTTRHQGYAVSQRIRKRIEEPFGWISPPPASARENIAAATASAGCSPSKPPPTT